MSDLITGSIGFAPAQGSKYGETEVDQKIYRTAHEAARRKFSPEFMNRIDKVVVFRSLNDLQLTKILELELQMVQKRIMLSAGAKFVFSCTAAAKKLILEEGRDLKYGARHLKRAIERLLVEPLSNLAATEQVETGDLMHVDLDPETGKLVFDNEEHGALVRPLYKQFSENFKTTTVEAAGAAATATTD